MASAAPESSVIVSKRARYETMRGAMWTDRASFDSHWQELGNNIFPRRTRFVTTDRNKGDKRNQNIVNSTARFAARTLSSGLHAGLTSPARPWMKLTTPDPDLAEFEPVKEWLHVVTQRMLTIFIQSNLYRALPTIYGDLGVFGTGVCAILEDSRDLFRAYTYPLGSYALGLDERGNATTFVREYELTVRQLVQTFGGPNGQPLARGQAIDWTNISVTTKTLWTRGLYETGIELCWVVTPNENARPDRLGAQYLPWLSCHFERGREPSNAGAGVEPASGGGRLLRESGFRTFPILAPRWEVGSAEDVYGNDCPGMMALGDIKQLQIMERRKGQAIAKMVDPPLVGPSALRSQKTSLLPGDITYVDEREGQKGLRSIHDVALRIDHLAQDIARVENRIQRAFFEDLFLMLANSDPARGMQPLTAREVAERHEEKLLALGPVLESTNDELLDPLVDRTFSLMDAHGLVPRPPQELEGVTLKVEYISILAQAQKLVGVVGQDRFLQSTVPLMTTFPEVRHKINIFQIVDNYAEMLGVDPRTVTPTDEAEQAMARDAEQRKAEADAQQAALLAKTTRDAGAQPIAQDSALDRVLSGVGGAIAGGA